jgi:hypothetical protein
VKQNLDTLKTEIATTLRESGFIVFHGMSRALDKTPEIEWDTHRYPSYQEFLAVAKALGVRIVVLHHNEFDASVLDRAIEELEGSELEFDEQRHFEKRLNDMKIYDGFTCAIELSFDHEGLTYFFELHTEWFDEVNSILSELDLAPLGEDPDEDDESYGGYYSKN